MNRILKRIESKLRGHPTVLWTGNGYHIYQPVSGFILEQEEVFAKFIDPTGKDLTSKFMQFAEEFLSNRRPSINSCLIRILGTINSKGGQTVKVVQRWDDKTCDKLFYCAILIDGQ